jgi:ribosomal protein L37E
MTGFVCQKCGMATEMFVIDKCYRCGWIRPKSIRSLIRSDKK